MRWLPFFILAYLAIGFQEGIRPFVAYKGVSPNLPLLAVVFISLNASRQAALLGSFLIGAMQDLASLQPLGLFAFSYGLVAIAIITLSESVGRSHPLTHILFTFGGGIVVGMLLIVHDYFRPAGPPIVGPRVAAVSVIFTTLLSPFVIGLLQLMQGLFGFRLHGRRK